MESKQAGPVPQSGLKVTTFEAENISFLIEQCMKKLLLLKVSYNIFYISFMNKQRSVTFLL